MDSLTKHRRKSRWAWSNKEGEEIARKLPTKPLLQSKKLKLRKKLEQINSSKAAQPQKPADQPEKPASSTLRNLLELENLLSLKTDSTWELGSTWKKTWVTWRANLRNQLSQPTLTKNSGPAWKPY